MQVLFVNKLGKTFAPAFFTVYYKSNGSTFKRIENLLDLYKFSEKKDLLKIELYDNSTTNCNPVLKDTIHKEEYTCTIIDQYSNNLSKAV